MLIVSDATRDFLKLKANSCCAESLLAEAGTEAAGRPRANRAEDWSARPPEEGCWGPETDLEAATRSLLDLMADSILREFLQW